MKKEDIPFGQLAANKCAAVFASWRFGIPSLIALNAWVIANQVHVLHLDPDLAFANFFLSQLTYFVDLVLMMSAVHMAINDREKLRLILGLERKHTQDIKELKDEMFAVRRDLAAANNKLGTLLKSLEVYE